MNYHHASSISKEWTIAALWISNLLDTARGLGLDASALLRDSEIGEAQLRDRNAHLPLQIWHQLAEDIQRISGEKSVGIHYLHSNSAVAAGLLGMAAITAPTMYHSWRTVIRYRHIIMNTGNTHFVETNDTIVMRWYPLSRSITDSKHLVDAVVGGWIVNSRRLTGVEVCPINVSLTHSDIEDSERFRSVYGDNVKIKQQYNSIEFKKEDWNLPIRYADKKLHHLLCGQAEKDASIFKSKLTLAEMVEHHIKQQLPLGGASVQSIATLTHLSPRTLQRQLTKEGTNFKDLLDNVRHELALDYLQDPSLSTLDIALKLGYNQASSFCTAFKGWTGTSPSLYFENRT